MSAWIPFAVGVVFGAGPGFIAGVLWHDRRFFS